MNNAIYGNQFFDRIRDEGSRSAAVVASWLCGHAMPKSVIDVGCGEGAWLAEFVAVGVSDFVGLDGSYIVKERLLIPPSHFQAHNLSIPCILDRRFDLAICLEVAEHLDERYAESFVNGLAAYSDCLMFSAAVPHQQGTDHRNEQWPQYWITRFKSLGYEVFDVLRPAIWNDDRVAPWYRQNTFVFIKGNSGFAGHLRLAIGALPSFGNCALVHPNVWEESYALQQTYIGPSAGPYALLSKLPFAAVRSIRRRLPGGF